MEKEKNKLVAGVAIAVVATGLVVGGVANSKLNDRDEVIKTLGTDVEGLQNALDASNLDADAKAELLYELESKFQDMEGKVEAVTSEIQARDAEIAELTAEISAQVAIEDSVVAITDGGVSTGYEIDDVALGGTFDKTLKDDKVETLFDGEISYNSEEYKVEEQVIVSGLKPLISSVDGEEFGADVYVGADSDGSVEYKYLFKEMPVLVEGEDLDITFLGRDLKIVAMTSDSITYKESAKVALTVGEVVDGFTIKNIGEDSILVEKDGEVAVVVVNDEEDFGGEVSLKVESIFYVDAKEERMVVLETGEDILKNVTDGEPMELFGEPDDYVDANWVWTIDSESIGASLNQKMDDLDDVFAPLAVGEQIVLPNDFAAVTFTGTNSVDYDNMVVDFNDDKLVINSADEKIVAYIETVDSNYDRVYFNGTDFLVKEDGNYVTVTDVQLEQDEGTNLLVTSTATVLSVGTYDITFDIGTETISDTNVVSGVAQDFDGDARTVRGDVFYNLENALDDGEGDSLEFDIASEEVTVSIVVN